MLVTNWAYHHMVQALIVWVQRCCNIAAHPMLLQKARGASCHCLVWWFGGWNFMIEHRSWFGSRLWLVSFFILPVKAVNLTTFVQLAVCLLQRYWLMMCKPIRWPRLEVSVALFVKRLLCGWDEVVIQVNSCMVLDCNMNYCVVSDC